MSEVQSSEIKLYEGKGFVRLVEVMGSDNAIEDAARISYGKGTRKTSETRSLIRYLVRHKHTSPLEQGVLRFHFRIPIFVMRQLVRHRTASLNEMSARYSEMPNDMYLPDEDHLGMQSNSNKQGTEGEIPPELFEEFTREYGRVYKDAYATYKRFLDAGVSREEARIILPVALYTEVVWQINLHNFMHFLKLREDSHAQKEIRDLSTAMYNLAKPYFPICFGAYVDYIRDARTLSRLDILLLKDLLEQKAGKPSEYGMSQREYSEFMSWWKTVIPEKTQFQREKEAFEARLWGVKS